MFFLYLIKPFDWIGGGGGSEDRPPAQ